MKTLILLATMFMFSAVHAQSNEEAVERAVKSYAKAGDQQDVNTLKSLTHDSYRLVWYGGKDAPFIADKVAFLGQFEAKKWGGDDRKVSVESVQIFDGHNATAKVVSDGLKAQMRSLFTLVKVDGDWQIIGELVNATFK